jgi:integrase
MWLAPALGDYRLSEINDELLEEVWNALRQLPAKNDSKKYGLAQTHKTEEEHIKNIWSFFENNEEHIAPKDRISKTSLKEIKRYLVCAIKWGKRKGHINSNPLEDVSLPVDGVATPRVPLPISTVRQITDYCLSNIQEPESWPVLIMIYHGMRNEEISNLTINDIITDPDSNVVYMNITDGKTENAIRKVPIHDKILKTGFMEYVDNRKHKLFDTTSAKLTLKFTHYRKLLQIPVKTEAGELLNLYSLRHNVITQLQDGDIGKADHVYKLVGHGNKTITLNYTHTNLLLLQRMINQVNYD